MKSNKREKPIKKILIPTDFSPHSRPALEYACLVARRFRAKLLLLHVVEPFAYSVTDTFNVVGHRKALETIGKSLLSNLRSELAEAKLPVTTRLVTGIPYREILKQGKLARADLIVMGTHGRTGIPHLVLGSVAEKVVRLSPCPVLTVRPPNVTRGRKRSTQP